MSEVVEYRTSNGHTVLMDDEDWARLRPLLESGVRLQSQFFSRRSLRVVLCEYVPPGRAKLTILLSRALLGASENQSVTMLNGPLDHRRCAMRLETEQRRLAWACRLNGMPAT